MRPVTWAPQVETHCGLRPIAALSSWVRCGSHGPMAKWAAEETDLERWLARRFRITRQKVEMDEDELEQLVA